MKKRYIQPTVQVTIIHHQSHLLAGSLKNVQSTKAYGIPDDLPYDDQGDTPANAW